jgi:predicted  nucleic acid-binding Zn-ribbon protein
MDQTVATQDNTVATPGFVDIDMNQSSGTSPDVEEPSPHSERTSSGNPSRGSKMGAEKSSYVLMKKSTLGFIFFLLLAFVVAFGYFFSEWMYDRENSGKNKANCFLEKEVECPFTEEDLKGLQSEIDRLEDLNGELSNQLDEYENLTDRLNASVEELKRQNVILSENNDVYENLNNQLNDTIAELKGQNEFLEGQVDKFEELNKGLNATVDRLEGEVDRLEGEVTDLTEQNDRLEELVGSLSDETDKLSELTDLLQDNVGKLENKISELETENDRLEKNIDDLETVASFLDEVAGNIDQTYEQVSVFLAEQIKTNRFLVTESLENTFHQRVANWDCALRDQYALEPFANDDNIAIPENRITGVLEYVDERVLSDLCLDKGDFNSFLEDEYTLNDVTIARLVTAVQKYTWDALDYYFPEEGETGLSDEDWADAKYDCGNLAVDQKYTN